MTRQERDERAQPAALRTRSETTVNPMAEDTLPGWCSATDDGITLRVRVVPGARRTQIAHSGGEQLRIRIAAPPVEGAANTELCRFLSRSFGIRERNVIIKLGPSSRTKTVRLIGDTGDLIALATTL